MIRFYHRCPHFSRCTQEHEVNARPVSPICQGFFFFPLSTTTGSISSSIARLLWSCFLVSFLGMSSWPTRTSPVLRDQTDAATPARTHTRTSQNQAGNIARQVHKDNHASATKAHTRILIEPTWIISERPSNTTWISPLSRHLCLNTVVDTLRSSW